MYKRGSLWPQKHISRLHDWKTAGACQCRPIIIILWRALQRLGEQWAKHCINSDPVMIKVAYLFDIVIKNSCNFFYSRSFRQLKSGVQPLFFNFFYLLAPGKRTSVNIEPCRGNYNQLQSTILFDIVDWIIHGPKLENEHGEVVLHLGSRLVPTA